MPKSKARKSKSKKAALEEPHEEDPALIKKKKKHSILSTAYSCARYKAKAEGATEEEAKKAGKEVSRSHTSINILKSKFEHVIEVLRILPFPLCAGGLGCSKFTV